MNQFTRLIGAHLFASVDGPGIARNIFLGGNTVRDSHSVNKKPFVADAAVGIAANFGVYKNCLRAGVSDARISRATVCAALWVDYDFWAVVATVCSTASSRLRLMR